MSPTDTWIQTLAQSLGGAGQWVALILFGIFAGVAVLATVSLAWHARWQSRERQRLSRELSRSVGRARGEHHG